MWSRGGRRAGALGLVLAFAVAGCTGDPTPRPSDPSDTAPPVDATETPPEPSAPPAPGPLEVYLGFSDSGETAEDVVVDVTRRENAVAVCMNGLGFEYEPQVPALDDVVALDGPVPGTRDFAEQWGYGAWTQPPGGTGGGFMFESSGVDPNWALREAMTESGREAYDTALWGPVTQQHEDGSQTRQGGCWDVADAPVGPDAAFLAGVRDEAFAYLDALAEDSRFAEVDAAWASCMGDAGLAYPDPRAAQQDFWDQVTAESADGVLDPAVAAEQAPEERRVAVADLDCQESTDWPARHREIEIELQQEYVDAHRADLDALAASLEQATGGA